MATKTLETLSDENATAAENACTCDPCECDPCTCGSESGQTTTSNVKSKVIAATLALGGLAAAAAAYAKVIRPWHLKWGATDEEAAAAMPGDELIPNAKSTTHAITVEAPVDIVWSFLGELGENKGGVYHLTWLENVIQPQEALAEGHDPQWQDLNIGDLVFFHGNYPPAPVIALDAKRSLTLGIDLDTSKAATWTFALHPFRLAAAPTVEHTRVVIRFREADKSGVNKVVDVMATEPIQFVIERKLLLTLKNLAEDAANQ